MVIEGTLALTGQNYITGYCEANNVLPGFIEGFKLISQDEHRHVAYGTWFLKQKASDPAHARRIQDRLVELLPVAAGVFVPPGMQLGDDYDILGYSSDEVNQFAFTALTRRLKVIGVGLPSAAGGLGGRRVSKAAAVAAPGALPRVGHVRAGGLEVFGVDLHEQRPRLRHHRRFVAHDGGQVELTTVDPLGPGLQLELAPQQGRPAVVHFQPGGDRRAAQRDQQRADRVVQRGRHRAAMGKARRALVAVVQTRGAVHPLALDAKAQAQGGRVIGAAPQAVGMVMKGAPAGHGAAG